MYDVTEPGIGSEDRQTPGLQARVDELIAEHRRLDFRASVRLVNSISSPDGARVGLELRMLAPNRPFRKVAQRRTAGLR
jgi:hypothetical protein